MDVSAKITSKGQVTIPKDVRDALNLQEGDELHFRVEDARAVIGKIPDFLSLAGSVPVPRGKRWTPWDDVLRSIRRERAERLLLADLVLAECVFVLESFYEVEREQVAELMRAALALPAITVLDSASLLRALEVYELDRLDFAEAYLVAQVEATGIGEVVSYDRTADRVQSITRREP